MTDVVDDLKRYAEVSSHPGTMLDAADEIITLRSEVEKLTKALRWYADENNYLPRSSAFGDGVYAPHVINDKGWTARAALEQPHVR